ncbi:MULTISPECIES: alginate lyase family protein [unclassified Yoonia]|uniref:alginate lyase family protein n=1 Tax=unclassified Yoonia TaxID=2629118 RepID=UPI002AFF8840|nr:MULTISPECIES: alginate lyase family protein [unclassified Yoonia]
MIKLLSAVLASSVATGVMAQDDAPASFTCPVMPDPVIGLDHGSRYIDDDKSRSSFDDASNDDVNAQLEPIDAFITALVGAANMALTDDINRAAAGACVIDGLASWAEADALRELATMNAQLAVPSRIAGLAFAYGQVRPLQEASDQTALIDNWLARRASATMDYFDTDAPPNASRNNLRAWAALGVARVGLIIDDAPMQDWAASSVRLVACQAADDGSLPLEMAREHLALHYQIHAVAPLVVTAALLPDQDLFRACDMAVHRSVDFVVKAFADPTLAEEVAGHPQTYFDGSEELRGFELAWAVPYLTLFYAPDLKELVKDLGTLGSSKLGGRQDLLWVPVTEPA